MPNAGQVIGELKAINKKLRSRNDELLAIVRELAGMDEVERVEAFPICHYCKCLYTKHDPDCLWLRSQKFKEAGHE